MENTAAATNIANAPFDLGTSCRLFPSSSQQKSTLNIFFTTSTLLLHCYTHSTPLLDPFYITYLPLLQLIT